MNTQKIREALEYAMSRWETHDGQLLTIDQHRAALAELDKVEAVCNSEVRLGNAGVFKGAHGLRALADAEAFWEKQPYGNRLYFGDGAADYLHRDILHAAIRIMDTSKVEADNRPSVDKFMEVMKIDEIPDNSDYHWSWAELAGQRLIDTKLCKP